MERILTLKPKIVVMASRWTQIEDLPYGREGRPTLYLASETAETTREASRRTFNRAIYQTVSTLSAAGIKVVMMGQVPEMLYSPARCFAPFLQPRWDRLRCCHPRGSRPPAKLCQCNIEDRWPKIIKASSSSARFQSSAITPIVTQSRIAACITSIMITSISMALCMLVDAFRRSLPQAFQLPSGTQTLGPSQSGTNRG